MFRYLAFVWNGDDPQDCHTAAMMRQRLTTTFPSWGAVFDQPGLYVSCPRTRSGTDRVYALGDNGGVILGTLFRRREMRQVDGGALSSIGADGTDRSLQCDGKRIFQEFWGSYVLFLKNAAKRSACAIRAPMSFLACFHSTFKGVHLFFSMVEDCVSLGLLRFTINWDSIRAQSSYGDYLTHETAINEIATIECGECLEVTEKCTSRKTYWSPCAVARSGGIDEFDDAVLTLRRTTQACVDAWAAGHDSILHTLSGGLDSSIVLSCLTRSPTQPKVTCVTDHSRHPVGDERRFARSMAQTAGVPLIERERNPLVDLSVFLTCARTARPVLNFSACHSHFANVKQARELGASAIFNGELGDNVFGSATGHAAVSDYFKRHGLGPGLVSVGLDVAHAAGVSLWNALHVGVRDALKESRAEFWSSHLYAKRVLHYSVAEKGLVSASAQEAYQKDLGRLIHPWLRDIQGVPLGKFSLIYSLIVITSTAYHAPFSDPDDPSFVAPLASQPLVESALHIASYLNVKDGADRAAAREAFASRLSEPVLRRRGKGGPDYWIRDIVSRNKDFLRETLLGGVLVKEGVLDAGKIEAVLSGEVSKSMAAVSDVIVQLYIEAWLRRWAEPAVRAAA
jgi:asparagine synthase (glutamine-hydrolysing)